MVQAIGAGWFVLIALGSSHSQHRIAYASRNSSEAGTHLDAPCLAVATTQTRFVVGASGTDAVLMVH